MMKPVLDNIVNWSWWPYKKRIVPVAFSTFSVVYQVVTFRNLAVDLKW